MTDQDMVTAWMDGYRAAWESNDPGDIARLFTEDAVYLTEPYAQPWRGRDTIVEKWLEHRDEPGTTTFRWHPVVVTDDTVVVQAVTGYPAKTYSNLWVLRFDAHGRAREFTEWWMRHPGKE